MTDTETWEWRMHREIAGKLTGRRTKWAVLAFWILMFVVFGSLAGKLTGAQKNDTVEWLPGNAESTQALKLQERFSDPDIAPAIVVYENPTGITAAELAKAKADVAQFREVDKVAGQVRGPVPSEDGQILQTFVPINLGDNGWQDAPGVRDSLQDIAEEGSDLTVYITGQGGIAADQASAFEGIDGTLLYATMAVVIIILLLTYRSPVLWFLPLLSAAIALFTAEGIIYLLADRAGLTVNAQSAGILLVLVLGAGTDYALLLVARYREELRRHHDRHEAMAVALHRAGPAIFASAGTVTASMLCLSAAQMKSTQGLGPVLAIGVVVALFAMLTLLPALLVICGRWMFWPKRPIEGSEDPIQTGIWAKVGSRIARRPRFVWVTTGLILAIAVLGVSKLDATGLSVEEGFTDNNVESVVGEHVLEQHGLVDTGSPAAILANASQIDAVAAAAADTPGVAGVSDPVTRGDIAFVSAELDSQPDSPAAFDTLAKLRDNVHGVSGADAKVGGFTAIAQDIRDASDRDNRVIIPIVLVAVFLILTMLLRALVAPLVLIATVVLSFGAALGLSGLAFHYLFDFAGADNAFPLFVFVFLVALGIDYNIFLMTRVREEALKYGTRRGALIGLYATGGVITSAGFVLAATFAVLGSLPLVFLAELGFAVALGVLLDTIVVRSVLVTALNLDIGRHMWWPSALSRKADVDVDELSGRDEVLVS